MSVKKAVIPAAGFGTRMLPATKAIPKEMLPIIDKPSIQYIVEEAVKSGIEDIIIVLSRGKSAIEDHFDRNPDLENKLITGNKAKLLQQCIDVADIANICFVRQKEIKGLGHAVLCAKAAVGNEPFAVLYGDDVIMGDAPATKELVSAYDKYGLGVAGIKSVSNEDILKYCTLQVEKLEERTYRVFDMIEKPKPEQILSNFAILGRVVLPSEIFSILENTPTGAGGEIQLTDAMKTLTKTVGMTGVEFSGTRYDMGNKMGVMKAIVETALRHEEISEEFKAYIKKVVADLGR